MKIPYFQFPVFNGPSSLFLRRGWIVPLAFGLFVDHLRGTPLRAAAVLSALCWSAWVLGRTRLKPSFPPALLLLLLWCAGGLGFSSYRAGTLGEISLLLAAVSLWAGASVLWSVHPEEASFLSKGIVALAAARALAALSKPWRDNPIFLDPGDAGSANIALTAMFLALACILGRRETGAWRRLWFLLLASSLWILVRWGATAALLGLVLGFPLEAAIRRRSRSLAAAAGAGALAAAAFLFSPAAPRWLGYNPDNPARLERIAIWKDSLAYARAHFWTGTGLGTFEQNYPRFKSLPGLRTANYAHNDWLQLLCETGLPGAFLAAWLLLRGLGNLLRHRGGRPGAAAGLAALGFWACVYFPFRSDPLLFAGALLLAAFPAPPPAPLTPRPAVGLLAAALLAAGAALSQGAGQAAERWGGAAWKAGAVEAALARFRVAARLDPLEPRHLDHQVECLRRLDRKSEAVPLLEKAVALKPRDIWLRRKLAAARLNTAGPGPAREAYAPILELAPNVDQFRREFAELGAGEAGK